MRNNKALFALIFVALRSKQIVGDPATVIQRRKFFLMFVELETRNIRNKYPIKCQFISKVQNNKN